MNQKKELFPRYRLKKGGKDRVEWECVVGVIIKFDREFLVLN